MASILQLFAVCPVVHADTSLPGMAVEFDGWKYIPIFENESVHSFVVLAVDPDSSSANITSMWFIAEGSSWLGFSWRTVDQKEAIEDIKMTLGLPDETDANWPVEAELWPDGTLSGVVKEALATGVFEDDPLLPTIESLDDPIELLSILVSTGWQASDAELFRSECRRDQLLNGLAAGFALELIEFDSGLALINNAIGDQSCQGGGIVCEEHTVETPPFGRTCTGSFSPGTPGTQPITGGCITVNSYSGTATQTEKKRIRKFYTDCTSCLVNQTRTRTGTALLKEQDTDVACPPPPGYVPPPASKGSCQVPEANVVWGPWSAWTPPAPGQPGSPCP